MPESPASKTPAPAHSPAVLAAAAVTVVLWASSFIAIRAALPYYAPGSMALLRMAVGSVGLGAIALVSGVRWPSRRDLPKVAAWGIAWFAIYTWALNTAEQQIDAGTAATLVNLAPLIVVALAGMLGEGFPRPLLIGAPVSFLGVVLIGVAGSSGHHTLTGLLLALLAAVIYATATLGQKFLLRTADATTMTWIGATCGALALLPFSGRLVHDVGVAPLPATLAVVYMGVFPTAVAFTTWGFVLQRSSAGRTAATTYVVPAVAIVLSWLLLGEVPTPLMLLGGVLCLLGVFLTRLPSRTHR